MSLRLNVAFLEPPKGRPLHSHFVAATLVAIGLSVGCSETSAGPSPTPPPATYGSPPPFPAVSDSALIYRGPNGLYDIFSAYHGSSVPTRFVLNRDSTFLLQFSSYRVGVFSSSGRYSRTDSIIGFSWSDTYVAAPWGAIGILRGDTLDVRYNIIMSMADFFDGAYVLSR